MPKKTTPDTRPQVSEWVHYTSHGSPDGTYKSECRPALVTGVPAITRAPASRGLDLAVFNPTGLFFNRVLQDEDSKAGGTWHRPESAE
jgi:hypothetical protein